MVAKAASRRFCPYPSGSQGELWGAAVASSCVGLRWRKKAWTWRIRPAMVGVGEFAREALSAPQMRSTGLSWGL
jgi:hypothetical protein